MSLLTGSRHPGDEDLIRYMDHQLDRDEHRIMGAHLRTCAECAARLEGWNHRSATVSEWLQLLPAAMPDDGKRAVALAAVDRARFRRRSVASFAGTPMRAAAAVVLMLAVGLATEPGRAFVAHGVVKIAGQGPLSSRLAEWLGEDEVLHEQAPVAQAVPAAVPPPTVVSAPTVETPSARPASTAEAPRLRIKPGMSAPVTFTPHGPDVTLVFSSVQAVGAATLWIKDVPRANGQVVTHYSGEGLVPTPDGLEVRNTRASDSDYAITIPSRFRFIRVRVADSPEMLIRISKSKQEWIWTINLQASAPQ